MGNELGFVMNLLDIGGGFPGDSEDMLSCGDTKPQILFESIAAEITPLIDKLFPQAVEVISEPGRYFATTSHTLAVKIFSRRVPAELVRKEQKDKRDESGYGGKGGGELSCRDVGEDWKLCGANPNILYYINDGLYGSFNCVLYDHASITPEILKSRKLANSGSEEKQMLFPSTVFGQTCDGFDCIIKSVELPRLEVGDWLVFRNMGAYTVAAASSFNGFSKPHTRYVRILDDGQ